MWDNVFDDDNDGANICGPGRAVRDGPLGQNRAAAVNGPASSAPKRSTSTAAMSPRCRPVRKSRATTPRWR